MDNELLQKYFNGACTPEEVEEVLKWFSTKELNQKQEKVFQQLWQETNPDQDLSQNKPALDKILAQLNKRISSKPEEQKNEVISTFEKNKINGRKKRIKFLLKILISILMFLGVCWLGIYFDFLGKA
ncbi:hypothetical protein [Adhaeribacter aquaticus]|uniref:hypothetical protein n=1 Tax=Adhaeribacter aquaticus TaxID=299567 RepID=UPI0004264EC8|nr:hypothetical protein [Adhaeribacter aquaticus]